MSKLVSIILPSYNGELFLKKAIDSCLNQTYNNLELIIVNDCSTDSTEQIIMSYSDSRIKYIKNETNQKLPNSLNIGFRHARGEYLTWTSDDNYYDENAIQSMVDAIEAECVDLVCAPYHTVDDKDKITGSRAVGLSEDVLIDNVVKACFLYKRKVHETLNGYNPNLFLVEDYDFWIRAAFHGFSFYQLKDYLYYYRFHDKSLTEKRRGEISKALCALLIQHEALFKSSNKTNFLKPEFYKKLTNLAIANQANPAVYFKKAVRMNPFFLFNKITLKFILYKMNLKG